MAQLAEYDRWDACQMAELVRGGHVKPDELLEEAITRIEAKNESVNAVVSKLYDEARVQATNPLSGPLAGVPFLIKDLAVDVKGATITQGCRFLQKSVCPDDSTLISRYRAAGLVFAGITNSAEFGLSCETTPSLFGPTRNPWDPSRSAGGSSGGAAAAVAVGIVPTAHANDGGGSIRIPASCCGLFGLKTSRGRTPSGPHAGEAWNGLAVQHVLSRTVRDSAAFLDVSHGPESGDPYHALPPQGSFTEALSSPVKRMRIAFQTVTHFGEPVDPAVEQAVQRAALLLEELGHDVEEARPQFDADGLKRAMFTIVGCNVAALLARIESVSGLRPTEGDFEAVTWEWMRRAATIGGADLAEAIHNIQMAGRILGAFFQRYDVVVTPTIPTSPPRLYEIDMRETDLDRYYDKLWANNVFTTLWNCTGAPAASIPLGWDGPLPIGVQFAAPLGHDARLLRLAAQLEEARPWAHRFAVNIGDAR